MGGCLSLTAIFSELGGEHEECDIKYALKACQGAIWKLSLD
jgi:hypothetical protein